MNTVTRHGIEVDLSYEHKTACPWCITKGRDRSGDNLHVYGLDEDSEHLGAKCFSCGAVIPSVKWLRDNKEITLEDMEYELVSTEFNDEVHEGIKSITTTNGKGYRGISEEANKFFGVRYEYNQEDGSLAAMYTPNTKGVLKGVPLKDALCGYGIRKMPKRFSCVGESGKDVDLFGAFRYLTHKGTVLLCAGQVDLLSAYTMLKQDYDKRGNKQFEMAAVVSPTNGEGSVAQIKNHYEYFSQFSKIIVVYDNDEAGRVATEAVAQVLPKGKVYTFPLRYKDVNEYLVNGKEKEFINDFFTALNKPYMPSGLLGSSSLSDKIREHAQIEKIPLPAYMHKLQKMMAGGIPLGVIVNLIGSSGQGKSTHAEEMVYKWIFDSPHKVGIISLESDSGEYGTKILSRHIGKKINLIESVEEKLAFLDQPWVKEKERELFYNEDGGDRFVLVDDRDGSVEDLKKLIETMIVKSGVKQVLLDPIQDVLASLNDSEQNNFMSWQKGLLKMYGVTIINISHTKKSLTSGGAGSQGVDIVEEDAHGSSSLYKSAAANLLFGRNKEAESFIEQNTTIMKMSKCRWTGNTSPYAGKYFYDNQTHTVHDFDDFKKENPHLFMGE